MKKSKQFPFELIGRKVIVVESTNKPLEGLKGEIVDETKETITLQTDKARKMLLKKSLVSLKLENGQIIGGKEISKRPEERIKG